MSFVKSLFASAIHLFYPHICIGCGSDLLQAGQLICIKCFDALPFTGYEKYPYNPTERIFFGRIPVIAASSGFYFTKGELVQHLIHELKYRSNKEAGIYLGKLMGEKLLESGRFRDIDYLVPLPLFPKKEFTRGFNQAEIICRGLGESMNVPVLVGNVVRARSTETQTRKHRAERWENVSEGFRVNDHAALCNKHILLVDDVITTGATIEACAQAVLLAGNTHISIAALAAASK